MIEIKVTGHIERSASVRTPEEAEEYLATIKEWHDGIIQRELRKANLDEPPENYPAFINWPVLTDESHDYHIARRSALMKFPLKVEIEDSQAYFGDIL